jgi:hypothetical protein
MEYFITTLSGGKEMRDLVALIAPFFSTPKTYAEMLKKLAGFAFYEAYIITFFLRDIPQIGVAFWSAETYGSLGNTIAVIPHASEVNISGFILALLVALASHVLQLHDRISDVLGIRRRFDTNKILLPLAKLVGSTLTRDQLKTVRSKRDNLMRDVFYRYASSRAENPLVDKHDIEHALAAWSWFWVLIEAATFLAIAFIIAFSFGAKNLALWFLTVGVISAILAAAQHLRLGRYARPEIETIASDYTASHDVRAKFDAL